MAPPEVTQRRPQFTVNNVAPSATFNAPDSVSKGSDINVSSPCSTSGTTTHEYRASSAATGAWSAYGASASHAARPRSTATSWSRARCVTTTAATSSTAIASPSITSLLRPPSTRRIQPTRARTSTSPSPMSTIRTTTTHGVPPSAATAPGVPTAPSASHAYPTDGTMAPSWSRVRCVTTTAARASSTATASPSTTSLLGHLQRAGFRQEGRTSTTPLRSSTIRGTADTAEYRSSAGGAGVPRASASHALPSTDNGTKPVCGRGPGA